MYTYYTNTNSIQRLHIKSIRETRTITENFQKFGILDKLCR